MTDARVSDVRTVPEQDAAILSEPPITELVQAQLAKGYDEGWLRGLADGKEEGYAEGMRAGAKTA